MYSFWKSIVLVLMILGWRAEAQAVPVDLLKTVVSADVSCDGAVDETAMLKAVQRWSTECNIELSTIGERPEEQIIRSLLDMDEMPLSALRNSDVKEEITGLVEPVLERWAFAKEELSASDKKSSGHARFTVPHPRHSGRDGISAFELSLDL